MVEQKDIRHIELKHQDIFHAQMTGSMTRLQTSISEEEIAEFCKGCDDLEKSGVCRVAGANDQGRYVIRKGCGWAHVDGVRGEMLEDGFNPWPSK